MNVVNHAVTAVFDALLGPLELLGRPAALAIVSAIFGVLALLAFKRVSFQRAIRAVKGRITGHLIEIRIYQDDLRVASRAIGKVLLRNAQYLAINMVPLAVLALPFAFVLAQLVVRFAFAPLPVDANAASTVAGKGTLIEVELERDRAELASGLVVRYPDGVEPVSPLVRIPSQGRAFQEVRATKAGSYDVVVALADGTQVTKRLVAGPQAERRMQGERGKGFFHALLWPAEDAFDGDSPFARVAFAYPDAKLGWFPGGTGGVLLVFLVVSMIAGALAMKPLGVQV